MSELGYINGEDELAQPKVLDIRGATKELAEAEKLLAQYKRESRSIKISIGTIIKLKTKTAIEETLQKIVMQYELKKQALYQRIENLNMANENTQDTKDSSEQINENVIQQNEETEENQADETMELSNTQVSDIKIRGPRVFIGSLAARIAQTSQTIAARYEALRGNSELSSAFLSKVPKKMIKVFVSEHSNDSESVSKADDSIIQARNAVDFGKTTIEFSDNNSEGLEVNQDSNTRQIVQDRYQKTNGNLIQAVRRNMASLIAMFDRNDSNQLDGKALEKTNMEEQEYDDLI